MKVTIAGNVKDIKEGTTLAQLVVDEKVENPEYVTVTVNDDFCRKSRSRERYIKGKRCS